MQRRVNEAEGRASEILAVAKATAESIEKVGAAIMVDGGRQAMRLDLAEKYITSLGHLANPGTEIVFPADLTALDRLLDKLGLSVDSQETS